LTENPYQRPELGPRFEPILCDFSGQPPAWDEYCGYECMTIRMAEMELGCRFPFELVSIGRSVQGRELWAAKIGDTGPAVLMGANIHGDEPVGNQCIQRWMWETCFEPSEEQVS
jgi:hypothetical protein